MDDDLYTILTVDPQATQEEIKVAFRRRALECHPDLHPTDATALSAFQALSSAYQILGDPRQREFYDNWRRGAPGSGATGDLIERFVSAWVKAFYRRPPENGRDWRYRLTLTLEEVCKGSSRSIEIPDKQICTDCSGSGASAAGCRLICGRCDGQGMRRTRGFLLGRWVACSECDGRGLVIDHPCERCAGEGECESRRELTIDIPAGLDDGRRLRIAGSGEPGRFGGEPGDLFVEISVPAHPLFQRDGDDLLCRMPIPLPVALLGGSVDVPTPVGDRTIEVPPLRVMEKTFCLKGLGIGGQSGAGDYYLTLVVELPGELDQQQQPALEHLIEQWGDAPFPETRRFKSLRARSGEKS